jgi:ankyrin repeat protein
MYQEPSEFELYEKMIHQQKNARQQDGYNDFMDAIYYGKFNTVTSMIHKNPTNINFVSCSGMTPIMLASNMGYHQIVKILLEQDDSNVSSKHSNGETALDIASKLGHVKCTNLLIKHSVKTNKLSADQIIYYYTYVRRNGEDELEGHLMVYE